MNLKKIFAMMVLTTKIFALDEQPTIDQFIEQEIGLPAIKFANLVTQRYYYLSRVLDLISNRQTKKFKHIDSSKTEKMDQFTLKPLFMVWEDFVLFRNLESQIFVEEFTKEILIIQKRTFDNSNHEEKAPKQLRILNSIPMYIEKNDNTIDLESFVNFNEVAVRFYFNQRLTKILNLLQSIERYHSKYLKTISQENFYHSYLFKHKSIKTCIESIIKYNSLIPLFMLSDNLKNFSEIKSNDILKEFMVLLSIPLKILIEQTQNKTKFYSANDLNGIPLENITEILDDMYEQVKKLFPELLQKPSVQNNKYYTYLYWIVPPLVTISAFYLWRYLNPK